MFVLTTSGIPCALKSPERQIWRLCPLEAADMALRGPFSDHNSALRGGGQQGRILRSTHTHTSSRGTLRPGRSPLGLGYCGNQPRRKEVHDLPECGPRNPKINSPTYGQSKHLRMPALLRSRLKTYSSILVKRRIGNSVARGRH